MHPIQMILLYEVRLVWMVTGRYQSMIAASKHKMIYTVNSEEMIIAVVRSHSKHFVWAGFLMGRYDRVCNVQKTRIRLGYVPVHL